MHIAAVQFDASWEDPKGSILSVSTMLAMANLPAGTLVILPEMFATGFSMNADLTLAARAETEQTLSQLALTFGVYLCGGLASKNENGQPENQAVLYRPDGIEQGRYAKRHLFTPLEEDKTYAPGKDVTVIQINDTQVAPLICYDLRFPEEFRAAAAKGAEVFVVLANWPAPRQDHWTTLLQARAIENQAYVVGVNRTGRDLNCKYAGGSMVVSPRGEILALAGAGPQILTTEIDLADLRTYRQNFPALRDMK
jgi:omega-amidase